MFFNKREIVYSAAVYMSKKDHTMIFLPFGFNKEGIRKGVNKVTVFKEPYSTKLIGIALRDCFQIVINQDYTEEDLQGWGASNAVGIKSNAKFVRP